MITSARGPRPADFTDVRVTNLSVVLRFVREHAPCSRADIAAMTGLNKATVSSLVADLMDRGMLREIGLTENRVGRPATMIVLDGAPFSAVGIEINVDYLTAVVIDLAGERLLSWRRFFPGTDAVADEAVSEVAGLARRVVNRMSREGRQVLGLAVAVPGLVDMRGAVRLAPNLGWTDVDLYGDLRRALREPEFPVEVENDANFAAMAEQRFGAFNGAQNLVYLTGEIGVGAGVVLDGRLRRGGRGYGGELGHVQIDPEGHSCRCGRVGCLEAVAGIGAVLDRAVASPTEIEPEIAQIVRLAHAGDRATLARLHRVARDLGRGVAILSNLLNPEVVILGGYYVPLAPFMLATVEEEVRLRTIAPDTGGLRIAASTLGHDAAALGAAGRVLDGVDSGRLPPSRVVPEPLPERA
ncbi:Sugar kinase of the NBD/HSP70 family, may contain an N-terminal HTH domain [Sinosporangium album]|uniref:Sugar kinase of the NBD/HSP70 family, may contain an N-terminal HTH domain n=1 Tax=Sinosporangium album TaxID=504805 RepID=A0A1G7TBS3_9ACTN|nr:ROK family transcriptional regulator [Sinosporangium album]SDG32756.1 Sugar kinase of the NBD/HSP70 family, may contain an N-terminal HTH domain [Sinosporangium album]